MPSAQATSRRARSVRLLLVLVAGLAAVLVGPLAGVRSTAQEVLTNDSVIVGKILAHLGLLHPADSPGPAPPSTALRAAAAAAPSRQ